jgi:hypothetical protein
LVPFWNEYRRIKKLAGSTELAAILSRPYSPKISVGGIVAVDVT